jgi:ATP-binding cassette, subfamily B (MDR/TAP), member 1
MCHGLQVQAGFWRLLKLNGPEWPFLISGSLASAVLGLQMPAFALAVSSILSVFYNPNVNYMKAQVQKWSFVFMGAGFGTLVMGILQQ